MYGLSEKKALYIPIQHHIYRKKDGIEILFFLRTTIRAPITTIVSTAFTASVNVGIEEPYCSPTYDTFWRNTALIKSENAPTTKK